MKKNNIFIMGLPDSGKTTFITALYCLITSLSNSSEYKIENLPSETAAYFEAQSEKWIACEEVERTKRLERTDINLNLIDKADNVVNVSFLDISGEIFQDIITQRYVSDDIMNQLTHADKLLFFINEDKLSSNGLIIDLIRKIGKDESEEDKEENIKYDRGTDNQILLEQVKIVEILQILKFVSKKKI